MVELQTIPYNLEAEQSVIGGLMLDVTDNASQVLSLLKPESFYFAVNRRIFSEMQYLFKHNQPIDLMTLDSRLRVVGIADEIGGFAYLAEIAKNTPSTANLLTYANIVRDEAIRRFALGKLQECQNLLLAKNGLTAQERLDAMSVFMSEMADYGRTSKSSGLRQVRNVAEEWLIDYERRQTNPNSVCGLSTGLQALDELLGEKRLVKQSLAVVGARPKCGKTAFYALLAGNCVMHEKKVALLFSLEMSAQQIFERMLSQRANINSKVFYQPLPSDEVFAKVSQAMGDLIENDLLFIDDTPNVSMAHIRNECRRIKRERGEIGLIAVDYLTLMKAEKAERNDLAYGNLTKELKNLAREMDCVVLLLTQLNRNLESRGDKRPMPSDSRDTGQIEQECDYWFGLYKESVYNEQADPYLTEILVRLNRYGETGRVYAEQRFGAMFETDQQQAQQRALQAQPPQKQKKYSKGEF